jgi:hypothetical protein
MVSKFITALLICCSAWPQSAVDTQKLQDAKAQGFNIPADMPVTGNITVEAVLLPAPVSKGLFGNAIAKQYAVIELTISNKSHDAALIVNTVFIDYSEWLMSGSAKALAAAGLAGPLTASAPVANPPGTLLSANANQVASVEYRIVRGEALNAQAWTARNWAMRLLQFLGVVATGSDFAFSEVGILKSIGAYTGQVIPAAQVFWPDGTVGQLDRISDFGFHTNKVIAKEASDIVVAFFPLDRFITPQLKKLFLRSPAVFFVPAAALVDQAVRSQMIGVLQRLLGPAQVRKDDSLEALLSNSKIKGLLDGISLNKVRVKVGGILSIDVDTVPARIDSVTFDDPTAPWDGTKPITGVLQGSLLSNGQPVVDEANQYGITAVGGPVQASSNQLPFTLHLSRPVPIGAVLHFHVIKAKDPRPIDSAAVGIAVPATSKAR